MLVTVAETNPTPVVALLPKLDALADEGWWEIASCRPVGMYEAPPAANSPEK